MNIKASHQTYENALNLPPLTGASWDQIDFANNRRIAAARRLIREVGKQRAGFTINDYVAIQSFLNEKLPQIYSVTQASDWLDTDLRIAGNYEYFDNCQSFQEFMDEIKPKDVHPIVEEFLNL